MHRLFRKLTHDREWLMAIRVSALFLFIGGLWIIFSDYLVSSFVEDPMLRARIQSWKGVFFVFAVALLLLFIIKGYLRRNRKLARSLQLSEERFRSIIEKSVSGICITNRDGAFEFVNPAFCQIYGYASKELLGQSITMLLKPGDRDRALEVHRRLFDEPDQARGLWDVYDKNHEHHKVFVETVPIVWYNEEPRLVTFVSDVTRQVQAENALRRSEKKYRTMMETLDVPIFITDDEGLIKYANPAFKERFGAVEETYCYQQVAGRDRLCQWCREINSLKPGEKHEREFHNPVDDRHYLVIMTAVEYEAGERRRMIVMRDLTQIIKAKERAEESDRLKTAFLANMSHEVRTPLNAILGLSGVLKDETLPSEEKGRFIDLINQSGLQLLNIIDDIVDVARIEQGNLRVSLEMIEIQPLLREIMDVMKLELSDGSKPDLELKMHNHLPADQRVNADPLRLKQVLMNLIGNAIKFTRKGYVDVEVFGNGQNEIVFDVTDTGKGIPPEKLDVIFERFRQVDESTTRVAGGNGLGLYISKNLVQQMGGEISVSSTPGEGSVFSIKLPYLK
ncbi:MAG: PAS domain-containing sensor histidine kinase [Bacteroidota bacterium]